MDPAKFSWISNAASEAATAGHIFAEMAACEAALESNFGQSQLAKQGNNLFGMKQHKHALYGTLNLPTKEYINNQWIVVNAAWVSYPSIQECFADRMATLMRLRDLYPHYEMAITAPDEHTYIIEVSQTWSTDPARAAHCIAIYEQYFTQPANLSVQDL